MTPKEKAKELVDKYIPHIAGADRYNTTLGIYDKAISKNCALIAVDEIINQLTPIEKAPNNLSAFNFWQEVKQEIEKL